MKLVILFALIYVTTMYSPVLGAISQQGPHPLRRNGGCYEPNIGHLIAGESVPVPGKCESANCFEDGTVSYYSCGPVRHDTSADSYYRYRCRLQADLWKTYPNCCPSITCGW